MSTRRHTVPTTSRPKTPEPDGFEELDLSSETEWDEANVKAEEIIPADPVTPWTNALQHSRAAAGNILNASTKFTRDIYRSGMGSAAVAVAAAAYATATKQRPPRRIRRPRSVAEKAEDAVSSSSLARLHSESSGLTRGQMLERVPIAVMGADIDGPDWNTMQTRPPPRQTGAGNRIIVGPAQRKPGALADGPVMLQSPATTPPFSYSSSPYSTNGQERAVDEQFESTSFPFAFEDDEADADDEDRASEEDEFVVNKEVYDDAYAQYHGRRYR
ncbi:hypothetical protein EJ05DRAFT_257454 [Pseudovirgaria hyperparasitica]|uniref:Uncharacterized protein n=1 Tax=Pseudovirgaria hyperparasitica TaxID=470096 RepID=A0A6A6WJ08_9PEZI|nr:uncharacterized protein EJ05DRAFT_257454 [Pseudovirgaria hyperparasitica]KAF2761241.1 hypothetical protein EJ05DRAFT_257454 [Pseudovirgaria hyperparasitica]